jgi:metallo-beta-lactamase family protein
VSATLRISFEGAARTVTGSRHRIHFGDRQWLFDCGLYQGHREEADRINRTFRFAPAELDAVVVSHAHLDHTGNLPTLVAQGYRGPIHAPSATQDLCAAMLPDSAYLMGRDVERVNRGGRNWRRPLYGMADVETTLAHFETHGYHAPWSLFDGVTVEYHDAGHILGSAVTTFEFERNGKRFRLCMGGDLGRPARPILRDPEVPPGVDALVLESTYGNRTHSDAASSERALIEVVRRTAARGGKLIVPAFAVGRTQELVATLHRLFTDGALEPLPMYVDSPLASEVTDVFRRHPECYDEATLELVNHSSGAPFGFDRLHYTRSAEESKALNQKKGPFIVIAASGMCEGGRILHHLLNGLGDERNTVLFVGFQAEGTLGRRLRDGAERVSVFGEPVRVRAEIVGLDGFSAHADQTELVSWVAKLDPAPKKIFLVHGEFEAAAVLAEKLGEKVRADVHIPAMGEEWDLWS